MRRSHDAWVLASPSRAFAHMAAAADRPGVWTAVRRPLFVALALASLVSLIAEGGLTARIAVPAIVYWAYVPAAEMLALVLVAGRSRRGPRLSNAIDIHFAGHGPWLLLLFGIAVSLSFLPPPIAWPLLVRVWLPAMFVVIAWSAYIDACYFRVVFGAGAGGAALRVAALRLITWSIVITIFAVPSMTPWGLMREMAEAVKEVLSR
jgi:hypothetical protein